MASTPRPPPVVLEADVLAVLPAFVRQSDSAAVRDALVAALTAILLRYQELAAYAASQCDIAHATGVYLDGLAEDRDVFRQLGEEDDALRARVLTAPDLVTPAAILAAANSVLAPYTAVQAEYAESILDRWFVSNGAAAWHSFIGANPQYPSRLYPDDAVMNDGFVRPGSRIGGAWAFGDRLGRYFILRVPSLSGITQAHAFIARGAGGTFSANGSNAGGSEASGQLGMFVYRDPNTELSVLQAISNAVNRVKGHSVRWQLVSDARLR